MVFLQQYPWSKLNTQSLDDSVPPAELKTYDLSPGNRVLDYDMPRQARKETGKRGESEPKSSVVVEITRETEKPQSRISALKRLEPKITEPRIRFDYSEEQKANQSLDTDELEDDPCPVLSMELDQTSPPRKTMRVSQVPEPTAEPSKAASVESVTAEEESESETESSSSDEDERKQRRVAATIDFLDKYDEQEKIKRKKRRQRRKEQAARRKAQRKKN